MDLDKTVSTMSYFNTDMICMGCTGREEAHPLYRQAREAEEAAVRRGHYNYPGIGCPPELYQRRRKP
jgi:hypothetical protein